MYTYKEMNEFRREAYEEGCIETLEKVFRYGHAAETHLNIISFLSEKGILPEQYKEWNNESNKSLQPTKERGG